MKLTNLFCIRQLKCLDTYQIHCIIVLHEIESKFYYFIMKIINLWLILFADCLFLQHIKINSKLV